PQTDPAHQQCRSNDPESFHAADPTASSRRHVGARLTLVTDRKKNRPARTPGTRRPIKFAVFEYSSWIRGQLHRGIDRVPLGEHFATDGADDSDARHNDQT